MATAAEVRQIIETEVSDTDIGAYISAASSVVTANLSDKGLADALLNTIEVWLAAHFIASTRERQTRLEQAGPVKVEYTGAYGEGLKLTSYGQMVLSLDPSGTLAGLGGKRASLSSVPEAWQVQSQN